MKIKFLKPFRLYNPMGDDMMIAEGAIENIEKEDYAKWLIDNGFAEEFKESGWWKPKNGETYYFIDGDGTILYDKYKDTFYNKYRVSVGSCFKTYFAADKCRDYWEAIATVRQDEGVLTPERILDEYCGSFIHYIGVDQFGQLRVDWKSLYDETTITSAIYFDTRDHAIASLQNHTDEWQTIINYDWSKE